MCNEYDDKKYGTPVKEKKAFVVMYNRKKNPNVNRGDNDGLVMLTRLGRYPLTFEEAEKLAKTYTEDYGEETFILTFIERYRRVSPVEKTLCHEWPYTV